MLNLPHYILIWAGMIYKNRQWLLISMPTCPTRAGQLSLASWGKKTAMKMTSTCTPPSRLWGNEQIFCLHNQIKLRPQKTHKQDIYQKYTSLPGASLLNVKNTNDRSANQPSQWGANSLWWTHAHSSGRSSHHSAHWFIKLMFGDAEVDVGLQVEAAVTHQNESFIFYTIFDKVSARLTSGHFSCAYIKLSFNCPPVVQLTPNGQYLSFAHGEESSSLFASLFLFLLTTIRP